MPRTVKMVVLPADHEGMRAGVKHTAQRFVAHDGPGAAADGIVRLNESDFDDSRRFGEIVRGDDEFSRAVQFQTAVVAVRIEDKMLAAALFIRLAAEHVKFHAALCFHGNGDKSRVDHRQFDGKRGALHGGDGKRIRRRRSDAALFARA